MTLEMDDPHIKKVAKFQKTLKRDMKKLYVSQRKYRKKLKDAGVCLYGDGQAVWRPGAVHCKIHRMQMSAYYKEKAHGYYLKKKGRAK